MAKIDQNMIVAEVLNQSKEAAGVFIKHGLHCIGCPSASGETIKDACDIHGVDVDKLLGDLSSLG